MDKKELILQALSEYSCVTIQELSNYIKRQYKETISPSSIAGALKKYERQGIVSKSNCGIGTHYWVVD